MGETSRDVGLGPVWRKGRTRLRQVLALISWQRPAVKGMPEDVQYGVADGGKVKEEAGVGVGRVGKTDTFRKPIVLAHFKRQHVGELLLWSVDEKRMTHLQSPERNIRQERSSASM